MYLISSIDIAINSKICIECEALNQEQKLLKMNYKF